ncbi:MAG: proton extrusion protein PcxA [Microcystis aeruginosa]
MPWNRVNQWVERRSLVALESAYQRALKIKAIEDKHFGGQKISPAAVGGKSVYDYFQSTLERELLQIRFDLTQVRLGNFINPQTNPENNNILETLNAIEDIIGKYRLDLEELLPPLPNNQTPNLPNTNLTGDSSRDKINQTIAPATGNKFFNFQQELTPEYEQTVIKQLRTLRQQQRIAIRFLLILLFVPVFVQVITKNFIVSPFINYFEVDKTAMSQVYIAQEVGERFLSEFSRLREIQELKQVLGLNKNPEEEEHKFREQVQELFREAGYESQDGWKNLLSDITGLIAFIAILIFGRQQLTITRAYVSRYFLSLNDITKAFIFILFTDIFVGFHSAEGWTVILETLFRHFGWRENIAFISLFVATVPVILDTIFKLLIFNYLTRKSPTAATILEKMNQ